MAETGQGGRSDITGLFERAMAMEKRSEKCYFIYAQYLDQLMRDAKQRQEAAAPKTAGAGRANSQDRLSGRSRIPLGEDQPYLEILPLVLTNYGTSVQCGTHHIFESLPRLLTLWFEFGSQQMSSRSTSVKVRQVCTSIFGTINSLANALPQYAWLAVLPQLISRICHQNIEVQKATRQIITRITQAYPQQALWALAAVNKSTVYARREAASEIITSAKKHTESEEGKALYGQFAALCDQLIKLCNHMPPKNVRVLSAKKECAPLVRMLPIDVVVPISSMLTLSLPASGRTEKSHKPFSDSITIAGIKDEVGIMASLQKPKKITLIGSNGLEYTFLAKPKDDLRKDNRMMEFAGVLNRLFAKDPASRRRNLYIRRFAVMPLTEDCGLVEWVPHTTGLRHCIEAIYTAEGLFDRSKTNHSIRNAYEKWTDKRKAGLMEKLLATFPPRLHRWFLARFPEPAAWLAARLAWTRTTAVWSMVGHITGLGDRHGENILVDATSGDVVQIDFACLFDKGLTLEKPEMVPFRLTQNIIDAFGVSGIEGVFRRVAEITLQVLRTHRTTLISVLETFVHDPLVEWTHGHRTAEELERGNPQAKDAMATIEGRLTGTLLGVSSSPSLPLSAAGQAHRLIEEAIDRENLGQMYIWWMAWN
ncbi:hypothetical protein WJX84_006124 [Apatococcus fuscideae]